MTIQNAAILAGGKSSRMGREKALIEIENQTLIARSVSVLKPIFAHLAVVSSSPEVIEAAQIPAIADKFEARGPLGGIHAALSHFEAPVLVVACDMPFLNADFLRFLSENWRDFDVLLPFSENGAEPLHAVYAPSCLPIFERFLESEKPPSLRRVLADLRVENVEIEVARRFDEGLRMFENWNTFAEFEEWRSLEQGS